MQNLYSPGGHSFQQSINDEMVSNTSKLFMNNEPDDGDSLPTAANLPRTSTSSPSTLLPRTTVSASSATKSLLLTSATTSLMASSLMHNSIVNPCLISSTPASQYSAHHYNQSGHHYPSQHSFTHNPSLYLDHTFYSSHYSNSFYAPNTSQIDGQYQQTYSSIASTDVQPAQPNTGTMIDSYEQNQTSPTPTILVNSVRTAIQPQTQLTSSNSTTIGDVTAKISTENPPSSTAINHKHKHISVRLMDMDIWRRFFNVNNEMIVTKGGR